MYALGARGGSRPVKGSRKLSRFVVNADALFRTSAEVRRRSVSPY